MAKILTDFLETECARASAFWGERDCLLFICNWIRHARGIDPAEPYRGKYSTERQCLRILKRDGGVAGIMRARTKACGLPETLTPKDGDIVLIEAPAMRLGRVVVSHAGGIVVGDRCAVSSPAGLTFINARRLAAWEVLPCNQSS